MGASTRSLGIIFGDQLSTRVVDALDLDPKRDRILMAEVAGESTRAASHAQRTVLFLSAMRHFAKQLRDAGWSVDYVGLTDPDNTGEFEGEIARACERLSPESVVFSRPGAWSVLDQAESGAEAAGVKSEMVEDPRFTCDIDEFAAWAEGRKELTMEYFYRERRKALRILVDDDARPVGGQWNFDKDNRKAFKTAPSPPATPRFEPDPITREVIRDVADRLPDLPGDIEDFSWPVTHAQAATALGSFIQHRLPLFGDYEDAMWAGERTLYHSALSPALNLGLLEPTQAVEAAIRAHERGDAPINAVEGFIRQIIGWREFIRGVYWTQGRRYPESNALRQYGALPDFYWTGDTDMACLADTIGSVVETAYAHHIPRLMVMGNFALIAGVHPREIADWFLGMFADGVDWATDPNVIGMSMHADDGVVGTKPYAASANYIGKMSNYCKACPYDPKRRTGENACPFNTFYWDFLIRNQDRFSTNHRMAMIMTNVERMSKDERVEITMSARRLRRDLGIGSISS